MDAPVRRGARHASSHSFKTKASANRSEPDVAYYLCRINLKTAKTLGLDLPAKIFALVDELIE
jgi:hypothetical protein